MKPWFINLLLTCCISIDASQKPEKRTIVRVPAMNHQSKDIINHEKDEERRKAFAEYLRSVSKEAISEEDDK